MSKPSLLWRLPSGNRVPPSLNGSTRHPCAECADLLTRPEWEGGIFRTARPGRPGRWCVLCKDCRPVLAESPQRAGVTRAAVEVFGAPVREVRTELAVTRSGTTIEAVASRWDARPAALQERLHRAAGRGMAIDDGAAP